jgi:hypothetical protein
MSVSCISCLLSRDEFGVSGACFGIDIVAVPPTPSGERRWVDIGADHSAALEAHALFALLGTAEPFFVRVEEGVGVFHDAHDRSVVFWAIPGHPGDGRDVLRHGEFLS